MLNKAVSGHHLHYTLPISVMLIASCPGHHHHYTPLRIPITGLILRLTA